MKKLTALCLTLTLALTCLGTAACGADGSATKIVLSDSGITVDGKTASTEETSAVYTAHDIIYYEADQGFTYGAGTEADEHTRAEADAHTVLHITEPGTYSLSGRLSAGQIAVDLGEDAADDPNAVVTLILNGADITCAVAPAVIFYNVYECGSADTETAVKDVDTSAAGANVLIADGTENQIAGSYVARIYKSYTLSEDGTQVVDNKKLHKYDGAVYSRMSMNVDGGEKGTGILHIRAENEGLDSELHLTINGGVIRIQSGNDGINTNEDGVSVTTVNGGTLTIEVTGETGEGDGIDSNGWLVINGGVITAAACSDSMDSGLDADNGIYINGGTVAASGNMYDRVDGGEQNYAVFSFDGRQAGGGTYTLLNAEGKTVGEWTPVNDFTCLVVSSPELAEGDCTLYGNGVQLACTAFSMGGGMGGPGREPDGGMTPPEDMVPPLGEGTDGTEPAGQGGQRPEQGDEPFRREENDTGGAPSRVTSPDGQGGGPGGLKSGTDSGVWTKVFVLETGGTFFSGITEASEETSDLPFSDVAPGDWCYGQILQLYQLGYLSGTGPHTFSPGGTLTRAQVVVMLYRMAGGSEVSEGAAFTDVAADDWYADAAAWAAEAGVVTGYADGTFAPDAAITRQQLAAILYRYAGSPESSGMVLSEFEDGETVADYAKAAMRWAVHEGLLTGTSNTVLSPEGTATRAQTAVIFGRYLHTLEQTENGGE